MPTVPLYDIRMTPPPPILASYSPPLYSTDDYNLDSL